MRDVTEVIDPGLIDGCDEARAFAGSVAGVLTRLGYTPSSWRPGELADDHDREAAVTDGLEAIGWRAVAGDAGLAGFAGLASVELGRRLAPIGLVDGLLGASPLVDGLARGLGSPPIALVREQGRLVRRAVLALRPRPSAEGLRVWQVQGLGEADGDAVGGESWEVALGAWLASSIGYLAGLGLGALDLTVDYVGQRRAFGGTLAALAPVQQLLAGAATSVRGVRLLAAQEPSGSQPPGVQVRAQADALTHAGDVTVAACAACQQVTGAIGFTLDYPLHRYAQRARALATWNDALLDALLDTG